jgi:hypothetical protein
MDRSSTLACARQGQQLVMREGVLHVTVEAMIPSRPHELPVEGKVSFVFSRRASSDPCLRSRFRCSEKHNTVDTGSSQSFHLIQLGFDVADRQKIASSALVPKRPANGSNA